MPRLDDPKQFSKATQDQILAKAKEVVERELDKSTVFQQRDNKELFDRLPRFDERELIIGRVIGRGGFCVVKEISSVRIGSASETATAASSHLLNGSSHSVATNSPSTTGPLTKEDLARSVESSKKQKKKNSVNGVKGSYVVKQVEPELLHTDPVTFLKGTIDLALETYYLATLSHPHVLDLKGMSTASPFEMKYFLVLDHLEEILSKRLTKWMHRHRSSTGLTGALTGGKSRVKSLLTERLLVGYDVCAAMEYLHSRRIIYRDLKPDNIGFDTNGMVKIFDFGLAKQLTDEEKVNDGKKRPEEDCLYRMTGLTGAIRYMAPEVGLRKPYNLKADVYSWSMLMWYILALEPPMGLYTVNMFLKYVFLKGYRPATQDKWPPTISTLLKSCWSQKIRERPMFAYIGDIVKQAVMEVDPTIDINDQSLRKGPKVMRSFSFS